MTADNKVLVGLIHGADEPENVLISYLVGVEALRAGKEAVMWLTKEGINVAVKGFDRWSVEHDNPTSIRRRSPVSSCGESTSCRHHRRHRRPSSCWL